MQSRRIVALATLTLTSCLPSQRGAHHPGGGSDGRCENPNDPTTTIPCEGAWTPVPGDHLTPAEKEAKAAKEASIAAEEKAAADAKAEAAAEEAEAQKKVDAAKKKELAAKEKEKAMHDNAIEAELPDITAARQVCKQAPNSCKAPCDKGDGYYCWGFGWALISVMGSPPRFADARNAFAKGCKLGVVTSCDWIEQVDREEKAYRDEVESLWFDVRNAANEVAHKHYLYTFATTKLSQTPQNVKGAANIQAHLKIIIAEQFCPAKKSFLLKSTEGDYSARAKQHCKDNPPVGAGLGGTQVTLTTECNGAFATTCP